FGGINLEDIKSPECFEIEETLERELDIPVFHDDQHGTAIVVTAALINALRVVGKKMEDVHIVLNGPGAAGTAIIKMLMTAGAKDIIAVDQFGTLYKGCNSAEAHKNWLGEVTNPRQIKGGLKEALEGADVFIGVSKPGILTTELCRTMNKDAIVFAMANPTPEIIARRGQGRRRPRHGHRPQRLPESGQQRPLLPRPLQGRSERPRPRHQRQDRSWPPPTPSLTSSPT
ncbi:NADP-dependent malic enzyme, partial [human gut metagenome]